MTITGSNHIMGTRSGTLILPMGTQIFENDAFLYPDSKRTLLSFKDICSNGFHVEIEIEQVLNICSSLNSMDTKENSGKTPFIDIEFVLHVLKTHWRICCNEDHIQKCGIISNMA